MFRKNCVRNSYLIKSCKEFPVGISQKIINEVFFYHIERDNEENCKGQEMETIENMRKHDEKTRVGYGKAGVESLLENLFSEDTETTTNSLDLLCNELKNPIMIKDAFVKQIVDILTELLLSDSKSELQITSTTNIYRLLEILALHHEASLVLAAKESLMKFFLTSISDDGEMSLKAASILMMLSQDLSVADKLLRDDRFVTTVVHLMGQPPSRKDLYEAFANFISRKPELFATGEVFQVLTAHLWNFADERTVSPVLKCLALITVTKDGKALAETFNLLPKILEILLNDQSDEEILTYGIMLMKNCMLNESSFQNPWVQWTEVVECLIQKSYTKHHKLLQQVSIQALRIISDKASVKEELRKKYKVKVRNISCLGEESKKLKDDLVQWLDYKNFKLNEAPKYSKLFI